jgi:predicted oxidoreductase
MADDINPNPAAPTPTAKILQCFSGAFVAGTIAMLAYRMMLSIATNFAAHPVVSDNPAVANISAAVRTLVIGMAALGAGVFGLAALGLFLLGIQLLVQRITGRTSTQQE